MKKHTVHKYIVKVLTYLHYGLALAWFVQGEIDEGVPNLVIAMLLPYAFKGFTGEHNDL